MVDWILSCTFSFIQYFASAIDIVVIEFMHEVIYGDEKVFVVQRGIRVQRAHVCERQSHPIVGCTERSRVFPLHVCVSTLYIQYLLSAPGE